MIHNEEETEKLADSLLSESKKDLLENNAFESTYYLNYYRRASPRLRFLIALILFTFLFYSVNKYFTVIYSLDQIEERINEKLQVKNRVQDIQNTIERYSNSKNFIAGNGRALLFPEDSQEDRIIEQIKFVPSDYNFNNMNMVKIFRQDGPGDGFGLRLGTISFKHCPVKSCYVTNSFQQLHDNHAYIFNYNSPMPNIVRKPEQIFIVHARQAPFNSAGFLKFPHNWTVSYRLDSDIPIPFGKWVYNDPDIIENPKKYQVDSALPKSRMAAIVIDECDDHNGRSKFVKELQKFIEIDVYGVCGLYECPEGKEECWKHLERNYKFYLSFENSNCKDYITDTQFFDALKYDIVPVVMGANPVEYTRLAPKKSYIHVNDFATTKELASYLKKVAHNDELYNSFFQWRGTGEFIDIHFPCRLCSMLHNSLKIKKSYPDIKEWFLKDNTCAKTRWQNDNEWINLRAFYKDF